MLKLRRRGPIEIGGQDGAIFGNMVNVFDGAINVNKYGMSHNKRKSYIELLTGDKTYHVWDDLGKPIYFEVTISCDQYFKITLIGDKDWSIDTEVNNLDGSFLFSPGDVAFIHDEEFKDILVEIQTGVDTNISMFASGYSPDFEGVNYYGKRTNVI